MGDKNYFPTIYLSAMQAKKIYKEFPFYVYDWGLTKSQVKQLSDIDVIVTDWKHSFVKAPFPLSLKIRFFNIINNPKASPKEKLRQSKYLLLDFFRNGKYGREWMLAQKIFVFEHLNSKFDSANVLFLDGDAILYNPIDELWQSQDSVVTTTIRRASEIDFSWGNCQVINSGVMIFHGSKDDRLSFIRAWIDSMNKNFEFLTEQSSLTRLIFNIDSDLIPSTNKVFKANHKLMTARIVPCEVYNYNWIEEGVDNKIKILHFKGGRHSEERLNPLLSKLGLTQIA